jgi:spore cortex biosynthesis protein YabQ
MEISVAGQAAALTGAVALGLGVGALYDLLRLLRRHMRGRVLGHALDLLFWAAVTGVLFLYAIAATGGQVRIYVLLAVFGGAVLYFLTLSPWVLSLGELLVDGLAAAARLICLPGRVLWLGVKKIKKNLKNVFHYRRRWVKIVSTIEEMEGAAQLGHARGKEGRSHANCKSRTADQGFGSDIADRRGYFSAGAQQPNGTGAGAEGSVDPSGGGTDPGQRRSGRRHRAQRRS